MTAGREGAGRSGHALKVGAGILLSRLAGFLRETLAGAYFGLGAHADVYSTAMRLPNLLQNLLGDQALSASFIPFYSKMLAEGRKEDARRFAGVILGLLLVVAGVLTLLGITFAAPLVRLTAPGFLLDAAQGLAVDRFALTVQQVRVVFPMAGLLVISAWALAVLNSHRRFFLPYFAPVLWNAAIIGVLLFFGQRLGGPRMGDSARGQLLYAAAWGALLGGFLQLVVQLPTVIKLLGGIRVSLDTRVASVRPALGAFGPMLAGRGALQLSGYLDTILASMAAVGAASALRFSLTLFALPIALIATSVAVTELPELSRLTDDTARHDRLRHAWRQISFLAIPTAIGFLTFGWLIVGVVFRRGRFGPQEQLLVALVLAAFTLGMVPATSSRLVQNLFYSLHETKYPARLAVLRVVVSVGAGALLMFWLDRYGLGSWAPTVAGGSELRLGAVGLGLGAALGSWVELGLLIRGAGRRSPGLHLPWGAVARMAGLALVAAAVAAGGWWLLVRAGVPPSGWLAAALVLGGFAVLYLGGAALLRFPELQSWLGGLRRRRASA